MRTNWFDLLFVEVPAGHGVGLKMHIYITHSREPGYTSQFPRQVAAHLRHRRQKP